MQNMNKSVKAFLSLALTASLAASCRHAHTDLLEQKWKMRNAEVYYQFRPDSTFTATEKQNEYNGMWRVAGDNRTLKMTADNGVVKVVTIKELNKDSMVLVDNYEDIVFLPSK